MFPTEKNYPKVLNVIKNPKIATTSTNATNNTINARIFPFISGALFIADIAHLISIPSQSHTPSHVKPIARPAPSDAARVSHVAHRILNEIINAYIAADSTKAVHSIETVRKSFIILGLRPITISDFSDKNHLQIATHTQARPIARPAPKWATFSTSPPIIFIATINPYIAVTSTKATNNTIYVIIFALISGFLFIAVNAHEMSKPSHQPAQSHVKPIANHAHIDENNPNHSAANNLKAITNQYITADSTNAIPNIVTVKKKDAIFGVFPITSNAVFAKIH